MCCAAFSHHQERETDKLSKALAQSHAAELALEVRVGEAEEGARVAREEAAAARSRTAQVRVVPFGLCSLQTRLLHALIFVTQMSKLAASRATACIRPGVQLC